MSIALTIKDENSTGDFISEFIVHFPAEDISARELIETRVETEVSNYNSSKVKRFFGLIEPSDQEKTLNGFSRKFKKTIDIEKQKNVAIQAFQTNGFFMLVDDKQLTNLDERIIITPSTKVVFIKLIPLIGG